MDVRYFVVDGYNFKQVCRNVGGGGMDVYIREEFAQKIFKDFAADLYDELWLEAISDKLELLWLFFREVRGVFSAVFLSHFRIV